MIIIIVLILIMFYLLYKNYRLQEKLLTCRYELERTMNIIDKAVKRDLKSINDFKSLFLLGGEYMV